MPIVTVDEMKQELGILDGADDALIERKINVAQTFAEVMLGYEIEKQFPDGVPADLKSAVSMLAAHAFEHREGTITGVTIQTVPYGVDDIIRNRRLYSFGG